MNSYNPLKYYLFLLGFMLFCAVSPASAGYLTIVGKGELALSVTDGEVFLRGTYTIENQGDEVASDVFPSAAVGSVEWVPPSVELAPNAKHKWEVDKNLGSLEQVWGEGFTLMDGMYPLFVRRYYRDKNGYQFTAAEVLSVIFGSLDDASHARLRLPEIDGIFSVKGEGEKFEGSLTVHNPTDEAIDMSVTFFSSKELILDPSRQAYTLAPSSREVINVSIENFKGLVGSTYATYAVLEWSRKNLRQLKVLSTGVSLEETTNDSLYLMAIIAAVAGSTLLILVIVALKSRKK